MNPVVEAWRDQVAAFDRDMEALRGARQERGQASGRAGGFGYANRPMDPHRTDDEALNKLFAALGSGTEVLDVGGGAGRFALPLATRAQRVTVVERSADSVELLKTRAAEAGITNITVINEPWEDAKAPKADMVLCSLVLHHVMEVAPFVEKLQQYATDKVVVLEMGETPGSMDRPFHERVYGSAPTPLPGLSKVMGLLWSMDIYPDVEMVTPETVIVESDRGAALEQLRRRLAVQEGTEQDDRLRTAADELLVETPNGVTVRGVAPRRQAIITWRPTSQD